uniref:Uncharacterized protein n=1 Tax=Glossina austeni TaxID=7395 RepID=A0A1A9VP68_GLOAU
MYIWDSVAPYWPNNSISCANWNWNGFRKYLIGMVWLSLIMKLFAVTLLPMVFLRRKMLLVSIETSAVELPRFRGVDVIIATTNQTAISSTSNNLKIEKNKTKDRALRTPTPILFSLTFLNIWKLETRFGCWSSVVGTSNLAKNVQRKMMD